HHLEGEALGEVAVFLAVRRSDQRMQGVPPATLALLRLDGLLLRLETLTGRRVLLQPMAQAGTDIANLLQRLFISAQPGLQLLKGVSGQAALTLAGQSLLTFPTAYLQLGLALLQGPGLPGQFAALGGTQGRREIVLFIGKAGLDKARVEYRLLLQQLGLAAGDTLLQRLDLHMSTVPLPVQLGVPGPGLLLRRSGSISQLLQLTFLAGGIAFPEQRSALCLKRGQLLFESSQALLTNPQGSFG